LPNVQNSGASNSAKTVLAGLAVEHRVSETIDLAGEAPSIKTPTVNHLFTFLMRSFDFPPGFDRGRASKSISTDCNTAPGKGAAYADSSALLARR
jgi:hypothetical protein